MKRMRVRPKFRAAGLGRQLAEKVSLHAFYDRLFETLRHPLQGRSGSLVPNLSTNGTPGMDNLAAILSVVRKKLGVDLKARSIKAA